MERRELLQWMVTTGGLAALNRLSARDLMALGSETHRAAAGTRAGDAALDVHAISVVGVAAEHIIPATETPGATDANVSAFVDHMLANWYPAGDRDRFLTGLRDLDSRSQARCGRGFVECTTADQLALLEAYDTEVAALRRTNAGAANAHWFAMLKYLTVWGYCTSEVGMRDLLHTWPMPMRYDGNAKVGT